MKISHSAKEKYETCPRMYKLHYVDKIRPEKTTSSLVFGGAFDAAINELLKPTGLDPVQIFLDKWTTTNINGENVYVPTFEKMVYTKKDFDIDLLTHLDYEEIDQRIESGEITWFDYSKIDTKTATSDGIRFYNLLNWYSLKRKGLAFIDAYKTQVLPKLTVIDIQREIIADNGAGDQLTGFIDLSLS